MVHPVHFPTTDPIHSSARSFLLKILFPAFLAGIFFITAPAFSQEQAEEPPADPQKIRQILLLLTDQALRIQKELDGLKNMPSTKTVDKRREELILQIQGLNRNFESIATKLQTETLYLDKKKEDSGWSHELEKLILPLLESISDITEKPRKIEHLKKRVTDLEVQLKMVEEGQGNIKNLLKMDNQNMDPSSPQTQKYLTTLESLSNKYNVELVQVKLDEARRNLENELEGSEPLWNTATRTVKDFFKHRGLNLLITAGIFFALWYLLTKLRVFIVGEKSFIKIPPWMRKLLITAYSVLVLMLCVVSSLVALYFMNDWLLLSVIILFMLAIFWASRQFIPRLFQEVRLALNLGTVKENERLIWNGVPWEVVNLGMQATLINPHLEGGRLQLPLGTLIGQLSRPIVEDEPWFPTQTGDWVILSDGTYGRVEQQTMEQVVLKLKGNTLKFYSTPEFLAKTPMNLSKGFRYDIEFGLDYGVQSRICDEIPKLFEKGLWTHLERHYQEISPDFTYTKVSFDNAGSSALNLKVLMDVEGRCAESYEEIKRDIQSTLVRICNENHLTIPFNQLTITLPNNLTKTEL
jgi:hypothetical protein